jgi:hypothetical protein
LVVIQVPDTDIALSAEYASHYARGVAMVYVPACRAGVFCLADGARKLLLLEQRPPIAVCHTELTTQPTDSLLILPCDNIIRFLLSNPFSVLCFQLLSMERPANLTVLSVTRPQLF